MPQAQRGTGSAKNGWPPSRAAPHLSALHLRGAGRIWTVDSGDPMHERGFCTKQKVGYSGHVYEYQRGPYRGNWIYGCSQLFQCIAEIFCGGPAKQLRLDWGTNFIAACAALGMVPPDERQNSIPKYLHNNGCTWEFNPPHASHMGGAWERMIQVTCRILDALFLQNKYTQLTHEDLCTLMPEISAIINTRLIPPLQSCCPLPNSWHKSQVYLLRQATSWKKISWKASGDECKCWQNEFRGRWRTKYLITLHPSGKKHSATWNLGMLCF